MKLLVAGLLSLVAIFASAQNEELDYKSAIKLYNLSSYSKNHHNYDPQLIASEVHNFSLFHPVLSYQIKTTSNRFHEFSIVDIGFNIDNSKLFAIDSVGNPNWVVDGNQTVSTKLMLGYEYILPLLKNNEGSLIPTLGLGVNPFFSSRNFTPIIASEFPEQNISFGAHFYLAPRIMYHFNKNLFLDLNIPVHVIHYTTTIQKNNDPSQNNNSARITDLRTFPVYFQFRAGLGFNF